MTKQELSNWFDFVAGGLKNHLDPCREWKPFDDEAVSEIKSLISIYGGEALRIKSPLLTTGRNPKEILTGMRQLESHGGEAEQKRTVSRLDFDEWVDFLWHSLDRKDRGLLERRLRYILSRFLRLEIEERL